MPGFRNIDLIRAAGMTIGGIFSPEHGFWESRIVPVSRIWWTGDRAENLQLYGTLTGPPEMPRHRRAGLRYSGCRGPILHFRDDHAVRHGSGAKQDPYYVLDRPNPITGVRVEGPMLDASHVSFVDIGGRAVRHGMTMGEWRASITRSERSAQLTWCDAGLAARDWFDSTNLSWINPSPNMRSLNAACSIPASAWWSTRRIYRSARNGRAVRADRADFIQGSALSRYLNQRQVPGVRAYPTSFTPTESNFKGQRIEGIRFVITNRELLDGTRLGIELRSRSKSCTRQSYLDRRRSLIGSDDVIARIQKAEDPRLIQASFEDAVEAFVEKRKTYLLY